MRCGSTQLAVNSHAVCKQRHERVTVIHEDHITTLIHGDHITTLIHGDHITYNSDSWRSHNIQQ